MSRTWTITARIFVSPPGVRGCSSMVEPLPSKQITRVRFPSSAPRRDPGPNRSGVLAFPRPYKAETAGGAHGRTNASGARHSEPPGHPSGVGGVLVGERIAQRPLLNGDLRAVDQDDETRCGEPRPRLADTRMGGERARHAHVHGIAGDAVDPCADEGAGVVDPDGIRRDACAVEAHRRADQQNPARECERARRRPPLPRVAGVREGHERLYGQGADGEEHRWDSQHPTIVPRRGAAAGGRRLRRSRCR